RRLTEPMERRDRDHETGRDREPGARHLPQVRALAADLRDIVATQLLEPANVVHDRLRLVPGLRTHTMCPGVATTARFQPTTRKTMADSATPDPRTDRSAVDAPAGSHRRARPVRRPRHAFLLAIAFAGAILALWGEPAAQVGEQVPQEPEPLELEPPPQLPAPARPEQRRLADEEIPTPEESAREARHVLREFAEGFYGLLPGVGVALAILVLAGILTYVLRPLSRRLLGSWERGEAASALAGIVIWVVALGIAFSVLAGDARALL